MMTKILLCADEATLGSPELLGLEGENLDSLAWLATCSTADGVRACGRDDAAITEAWMVSCDDIDPINAAAALKKDRDDVAVFLVSPKGSGSLKSRANAAGIDAVISTAELVRRFGAKKAMASGDQQPVRPPVVLTETKPLIGAPHAMRPEPLVQPQSDIQKPKVLPQAKEGKEGYVLAVAGASGGCGKSAVSVVMACAAAAAGIKTLLLDGDAQFGDAARLMGLKEYVTAEDCVIDSAAFDKIPHAEGRPDVIAAPRFLEHAEVVSQGFAELLAEARSRYEVVIANTGSFWGDVQLQLFESANNVVLLVDQRPSSVHATKHAMALCSRCGIATLPFVFAVNKCGKNAVFTSADVSCALDGVAVEELADGGMAVEEALSGGNPWKLLEGNPFGASVARLLFACAPQIGSADPERVRQMTEPPKRKFFQRRKKEQPCL